MRNITNLVKLMRDFLYALESLDITKYDYSRALELNIAKIRILGKIFMLKICDLNHFPPKR